MAYHTMEMLFTEESIQHIYLPYAIMIYHRAVIHGKEKLRIIILYRKERPEFPCKDASIRVLQAICYLIIAGRMIQEF